VSGARIVIADIADHFQHVVIRTETLNSTGHTLGHTEMIKIKSTISMA
jgi:hypothetical protein